MPPISALLDTLWGRAEMFFSVSELVTSLVAQQQTVKCFVDKTGAEQGVIYPPS